ncbi:hypothetical protein B6S08_08745 [Oceanimonas doudoroffii]|uniref:Uncharacterized protein n=1 Tax=Oceanimonas doudoroffii TaxID=84158 RepID=A0A233RJI5_9GAMM|nr:hypothetical protein B6S08_08745 [Oceanimonas doudoroffii]
MIELIDLIVIFSLKLAAFGVLFLLIYLVVGSSLGWLFKTILGEENAGFGVGCFVSLLLALFTYAWFWGP